MKKWDPTADPFWAGLSAKAPGAKVPPDPDTWKGGKTGRSKAIKEAAALVEALGGDKVPLNHPARKRYLRLLAEER